jgi:hypothetical protein
VDKTNDHVRDVINDPEKTLNLVESLKKIIDTEKYILSFLPNEQSIDTIKVIFVYPIDWLNKKSLHKEIIQTWIHYGNVLLHFELKSGRPTPDLKRFRKPK